MPPAWPAGAAIDTPRLRLEPLRADHAAELAPLLDDAALHAFTGGAPLPLADLERRSARLAGGRSPDGAEGWLNWVVRRREDDVAVGTVQATTSGDVAALAWVVATPHQGRGYAREAAAGMAAWLRGAGVRTLVAHIHPDHAASAAVARAIGLAPTPARVDGEVRWTSG